VKLLWLFRHPQRFDYLMTMHDGHSATWAYQSRYYSTHIAAPADFTGSFTRDHYTVHGRPTFDQLLADVVIGGGPWDAIVCYGPFNEQEWPAVKEHAGQAVVCLDYAGGPLCGLNGEPPAMAPLFDHVFTAHETQAAFLRGIGVSATKARGVPTNHYRPIPGVPKLWRVIAPGQFSCGKRHPLVAEYCERFAPQKPSLFIGGFETPAIVDMVKMGGIPLNKPEVPHRNNIQIGQRAPYAVMPLLYNAAEVCIVGSQEEAGPWVALEAMACGTPVVVMSDCAWLVAESFAAVSRAANGGVHVVPPDPVAIHGTVEGIMGQYARESRLARAAIIDLYDWWSQYAETDSTIKRLVGLKLAGQSLAG
jgi:glycosyltransferase involved in cell wall biosynthesis